MTELAERMAVSVVWLLVLVGFATSYLLWTIDTASPSGESLFALYLSMDLIAFAMITYVYRVTKLGDDVRRIPLLSGCVLLILLLAVGLTV